MNGKNAKAKAKRIALLLAAAALFCAFGGCMGAGEKDAFETQSPTAIPLQEPERSESVTEAPTEAPTEVPTETPTEEPTPEPSAEPTEAPTEEPTPSPTKTSKPTATPKPDDGGKTITLAFVGDLMCLSAQQYGAMNQAGSGQRYDFSPSFKYVKDILSRADCAIGNLETTLSDSWPYATQEKEIDGKPNCNGPKEYLDALKYAGFDALATCNNHCCDAGKRGITDTLDAIESRGFKHTGTFRSSDEKRYVMLSIKGVKVALLSYSEFYNGKQGCVGDDTFMLNTYSKAKAERDIANARKAGAQLVVVYEHWGKEHSHEPTDTVRQHARELAEAGADIICGSHSHAVQPVVWLRASDGRKVLCMYSLGNFVSSMSQQAANDTFIEEVKIKVSSDGSVKISSEKSHPCRVFSSLNGKNFVVVPTSNTSLSSIQSQLAAAKERIMSIIQKERG